VIIKIFSGRCKNESNINTNLLKETKKYLSAICEMVLAHHRTGRNFRKDKGLVFAVRNIGPLSASGGKGGIGT
jgi:hypothetical protein